MRATARFTLDAAATLLQLNQPRANNSRYFSQIFYSRAVSFGEEVNKSTMGRGCVHGDDMFIDVDPYE